MPIGGVLGLKRFCLQWRTINGLWQDGDSEISWVWMWLQVWDENIVGFVVVEMFIEVGTSWGLVEEIDGDEMKPSLMAEITTVVCGVTSRELWFWELCVVKFWDVKGCCMVSGWLKGDSGWVTSATAKGALPVWGLLWDKSHLFGLMRGGGCGWFRGLHDWGWSPGWKRGLRQWQSTTISCRWSHGQLVKFGQQRASRSK